MYTVGKVSYAIKNDKRGNPPPNPTIGTRNTARFDGRFVSKTGDKEWDEASKDQRKTIVKDLVREQTKLKRNQRDRERRAPDRNEKENGKDDEPGTANTEKSILSQFMEVSGKDTAQFKRAVNQRFQLAEADIDTLKDGQANLEAGQETLKAGQKTVMTRQDQGEVAMAKLKAEFRSSQGRETSPLFDGAIGVDDEVKPDPKLELDDDDDDVEEPAAFFAAGPGTWRNGPAKPDIIRSLPKSVAYRPEVEVAGLPHLKQPPPVAGEGAFKTATNSAFASKPSAVASNGSVDTPKPSEDAKLAGVPVAKPSASSGGSIGPGGFSFVGVSSFAATGGKPTEEKRENADPFAAVKSAEAEETSDAKHVVSCASKVLAGAASASTAPSKPTGRDRTIDFEDLTHIVAEGKYAKFQGTMIKAYEEKGKVDLLLMKNARGNKIERPLEVTIKKSHVRALDSDDMIGTIDIMTDEAEEEELIEYEKGTWECSKCKYENGNDAGGCENIVNGKRCGGTKKCAMNPEGWGDLFNKFKPNATDWKCKECDAHNAIELKKCGVCETPMTV